MAAVDERVHIDVPIVKALVAVPETEEKARQVALNPLESNVPLLSKKF